MCAVEESGRPHRSDRRRIRQVGDVRQVDVIHGPGHAESKGFAARPGAAVCRIAGGGIIDDRVAEDHLRRVLDALVFSEDLMTIASSPSKATAFLRPRGDRDRVVGAHDRGIRLPGKIGGSGALVSPVRVSSSCRRCWPSAGSPGRAGGRVQLVDLAEVHRREQRVALESHDPRRAHSSRAPYTGFVPSEKRAILMAVA